MLNYPFNSSPRLVHRKISTYFSDELSGSNCIWILNTHKFQKICYSGTIPFVFVAKEEIHKYMWYEVSVTVNMGRIANQ